MPVRRAARNTQIASQLEGQMRLFEYERASRLMRDAGTDAASLYESRRH